MKIGIIGAMKIEVEKLCNMAENIKKERLHRLSQQQDVIKRGLLESYVCKTDMVEVLFESFDGEYILGHTPNFIEVKVKSECARSNQLLAVKPISTDGEYVFAKII